jgi:hypothetical protein
VADLELYGDTEGTLGDRTRAGDQTIRPNAGQQDTALVVGDADALVDRAQGGDDNIGFLLAVRTTLIGDAITMSDRAQGGDDTIDNVSGIRNAVYGDAESMTDRARGGDDLLAAPSPPFTRTAATSDIYGDAYSLTGRTEGGNDTLEGAVGYLGTTARLYGDGHDLLDHARGGDDRLVSVDYRSDEMWGDAFTVGPKAVTGHDTFVFGLESGHDIIHDFEQGKDVIDLTAFAAVGVHDFDDLAPLLFQQSDGVLIILDIGPVLGNTVLVAGASGLTASDFVFG